MRKSIILTLVVLFLFSSAVAESDLSSMDTDELVRLRDLVNLELASRTQTGDNALAVWDSTFAHVELLEMKRGTTDDGLPGICLLFSYTNTNTEIDDFRAHHWVKVYQNGVECDRTIRLDGELVNTDSWDKSVQPGATFSSMTWFFIIPEDTATIDVEIEDRASSFKSAGVLTVALPD